MVWRLIAADVANEYAILDSQLFIECSVLPITHGDPYVQDQITIGSKPNFDDPVRLEVQLITPLAKLPFRNRDTDAGYDLYSIEKIIISPNRTVEISTGIKIAAPPGWYYTIEGRSSLKKVGVVPHRGIIDSTYCGEVIVRLINFSDEPYAVGVGDRVAQIILHRQYDANFEVVEQFSSLYNQRGEKGFGSTGR